MKSTTYQIINKTAIPGGTLHDALLWLYSNGGGGVTAHGALTGLGNDDHTQYFNQSRGDARYSLVTHGHSLADVGSAGFMSASDFSKLAGIAAGATANTGTVTSINASGGATGLSFTGGPVTASGTLTLTGILNVASGGTGTTTSTGTGNVVLSASPTLTGTTNVDNINFVGTARRITGDFSNATVANRVLFKTSTANGASVIGVIPDGTGGYSEYSLYNTPDTTNFSKFDISVSASAARIRSAVGGTGTALPINIETPGGTALQIGTNGSVLALRGGLGYGPGAGGTITQTTSKSTAVTLNKLSGKITTASDALAAGAEVNFTFNNSFIEDGDNVLIGGSVGVSYTYRVGPALSGQIAVFIKNNTAGSLSNALVIDFKVIKGSTT